MEYVEVFSKNIVKYFFIELLNGYVILVLLLEFLIIFMVCIVVVLWSCCFKSRFNMVKDMDVIKVCLGWFGLIWFNKGVLWKFLGFKNFIIM